MCLGFGIYFMVFLNCNQVIRHFCFANWLLTPWIQKVSGHLAGDFFMHTHSRGAAFSQ